MEFIRLEGLSLKKQILNNIKKEVTENKYDIKLVTIQVGDNPASSIYIKNKISSCIYAGVKTLSLKFEEDTKESVIISKIQDLNNDKSVNGIMVQLPLPAHLNRNNIINAISESKDVDGITDTNLGKLVQGGNGFIPCTPKGIIRLLQHHNINFKPQSKVVIVGTSIIVGLPLSIMFKNMQLTVTTCNIFTTDIEKHIKTADLLVSAIGKRDVIKTEWLTKKQYVIDIGINRYNNKVVGDINFELAKKLLRVSHQLLEEQVQLP